MSAPTFIIGEPDDSIWFQMKKAFGGTGVLNDCIRVRSSREILARVRLENEFPVIVLNLSDSLGVLDILRADSKLRAAVVILMGSADESQILASYQRGANSYIIIPPEAGDWSDIFTQIIAYWTHTALLPQRP